MWLMLVGARYSVTFDKHGMGRSAAGRAKRCRRLFVSILDGIGWPDRLNVVSIRQDPLARNLAQTTEQVAGAIAWQCGRCTLAEHHICQRAAS
jgi:hypothetical protein